MLIRNLDDVLPHVEGRKDFVVVRKDRFTVVDYVYAGPDTFDHPVRRECRGLKFSPDGELIARPLHKFFNVGERPETLPDQVDFTRPHVVLEKLDGSMIHPILHGGPFTRFCTRMGITEVAEACENEHLRPWVDDWCAHQLNCGITPIFEWVSPKNRIVVGYPDDRLVLLAMRDTISGEYADWEYVFNRAVQSRIFDAPRTLGSDAYGDWAGLAKHVEGLEGEEGFVVWFTDGKQPSHVKVKAPWYVTRHRALDGLRSERRVVELVLDGALDDVVPLLDPETRKRLDAFAARFNERLDAWACTVQEVVDRHVDSGLERGTFAGAVNQTFAPVVRPVVFRTLDGADPRAELIASWRRACSNPAKLGDALDELVGARW